MTRYRHDAWQGLLDAERLSRYYLTLAARLRRRRRALDSFIAVSASSAVGSLLLAAPSWALAAFVVAAGAASAWSLVSRHVEHAALLAPVGERLSAVAGRWALLWSEIDALDDAEAKRRIEELNAALDELTEGVPPELAEHRRLNERCAADAYAVAEARYRVAAT